MAFAHGKILLLGEHAVVHGEPAISAGLDAGISATAGVAEGAARLRIPAWDLDLPIDAPHRVATAFRALVEALGPQARGWSVTAIPNLPPGAGLGSSAALSVAAARAILEASGASRSEEELFDAVMAAERVYHGNPSGLDHATAMRGGLLRFLRGSPPRMETLPCGASLTLVVAQVEPGADTGRMVAAVAARRERLPGPVGRILSAIGELVGRAERALAEGDQVALGEAFDVNHGLLCALGVSTARLDAACHGARAAGALGAKLTGAGGGGCMIALVEPERAPGVLQAVRVPDRPALIVRIGTGEGA